MDDPRVFYAAERTLLAWIRTGLAMMGFGFVVARFGLFLRELAAAQGQPTESPTGLSLWFGTAMIVAGVVVLAASMFRYCQDVRLLTRSEILPPKLNRLAVALGAFLAFLGAAMAAYLIWLT